MATATVVTATAPSKRNETAPDVAARDEQRIPTPDATAPPKRMRIAPGTAAGSAQQTLAPDARGAAQMKKPAGAPPKGQSPYKVETKTQTARSKPQNPCTFQAALRAWGEKRAHPNRAVGLTFNTVANAKENTLQLRMQCSSCTKCSQGAGWKARAVWDLRAHTITVRAFEDDTHGLFDRVAYKKKKGTRASLTQDDKRFIIDYVRVNPRARARQVRARLLQSPHFAGAKRHIPFPVIQQFIKNNSKKREGPAHTSQAERSPLVER